MRIPQKVEVRVTFRESDGRSISETLVFLPDADIAVCGSPAAHAGKLAATAYSRLETRMLD